MLQLLVDAPRLLLVTENLALRQQLQVLQRATWVALSHLWQNWHSTAVYISTNHSYAATMMQAAYLDRRQLMGL